MAHLEQNEFFAQYKAIKPANASNAGSVRPKYNSSKSHHAGIPNRHNKANPSKIHIQLRATQSKVSYIPLFPVPVIRQ